jgi:hypothetical protein
MRQVTITVPAPEAARLSSRELHTRAHEAAALLMGTTGDLVDLTHETTENENVTMTFERALALVGAA